jgi:hypothetical protein
MRGTARAKRKKVEAVDPTVHVSDEFRALFHAWRRGAPVASATEPVLDGGFAELPGPPPSPPPAAARVDDDAADGTAEPARCAPPVVETILRRDGRRPLKLRAALLARWRQPDPASGARFELALHLAEDGVVAAALSLTAAEGDPLRPLHVAATLDDPGALGALVRGFDPAAACAAGDATDPAAVAASVETARALRDAYARFTAWARRSGALMEQD